MDTNATPATNNLRPDMLISEISQEYPEIIETLIIEYGFHCIGCFASEFETLEEGARVHGIIDEDFEMMIKHLEGLIAEQQASSE